MLKKGLCLGTFIATMGIVCSAWAAKAPDQIMLKKAIGTRAQGWLPKALSKLKAKMTPEQVDKLFSGAGKISRFGFSNVPFTDIPGATSLKFYFAKDRKTKQPTQLKSVTVMFDPQLTEADGFYDQLVKVLVAKYGRAKKGMVEKKLITWVNRRFKTAQLSLFPSRMGKYFQLRVSL